MKDPRVKLHVKKSKAEEKEPEVIEVADYVLLEPWRNTNSGSAKWSFATRDGKTYFIKEFLRPVFPTPGVLSPESEAAKRKICFAYYRDKSELYGKIADSATGNLVLIRDFFLFGTKYYITTDKIEQCNITADKVVHVSKDKQLVLLKILADGLVNLHKNGVVHADLKPTNVLIKLSGTGQVVAKIIDFDGSYLVGRQPSRAEVQGDQPYYAPETYRYVWEEDITLTTKVDVFACGLLFHLYLTGALPEIPSEYDSAAEALLNGDHPKLSPTLSPEYAQLIESMLAVEPEDRPSMEQVLETLKAMDKTEMPEPVKKTEPKTESESEPKQKTRLVKSGFTRPTSF